jgi:hypothetical protein
MFAHKMLICVVVIWSSERTHTTDNMSLAAAGVRTASLGGASLIARCRVYSLAQVERRRAKGRHEIAHKALAACMHDDETPTRCGASESKRERETRRFQSNYLSICSHSTRTVRMEKELERAASVVVPYMHIHTQAPRRSRPTSNMRPAAAPNSYYF